MPRSKKPRKEFHDRFQGPYKERRAVPKEEERYAVPPEFERRAEGPHLPPPGRLANKRGMLIAAGAGAATAGGAAYLVHRRRSKVDKLYDPYSDELVDFSKRAPVGPTPQFGTNVRSVAPRTAEGPHVSHANKLLVKVQRGRSKTPPPGLVRYTGQSGNSQSAMSKGLNPTPLGRKIGAGIAGVGTAGLIGAAGARQRKKSFKAGEDAATDNTDSLSKAASNLDGASVRGGRGTPLSTMAHANRVGHRLTSA